MQISQPFQIPQECWENIYKTLQGDKKKPHICTNYINSQKHVETDVDGKFCVYIFGIFNSLLRQAVVKISPGLFSGEVFYVILFMNFLHAFDREKRI